MAEHRNNKYIRRLRIIKREVDELIKEIATDLEQTEEQPAPARRRATPCDPTFEPHADSVAWARKDYPEVDLVIETRKFKNYWISSGGLKKDWDRTWENWIIQSVEYASRGGKGVRRNPSLDQTNRDRASRVAARLTQRIEQPDPPSEDPFELDQ